MAVQIDKRRVKEQADTPLITPHGAQIVVTASRAAALLARPAIRFNDGIARVYSRPGDDNVVEETVSGAKAPRTGDKRNAGE